MKFLTGSRQSLPGPVNYLFHLITYLSSTSLGSLLRSSATEECGLNNHDKSRYLFWCSPLYLGCCFGMKVHELPVNLFYHSDVSLMETQSVSFSVFHMWLWQLSRIFFEFSLGIVRTTPWHRFSSWWGAPMWCALCWKDCLLSVSNKISISAVAQYWGVLVYVVPCLLLVLAFDCWVHILTYLDVYVVRYPEVPA